LWLDARVAVPVAAAVAALLVAVWMVRSVPRTLAALAVAALVALALNPMVEAVRSRAGWQRSTAAGCVLGGFAVAFGLALTLVAVPTIDQVRRLDEEIPRVVDDLADLPLVGARLEEADAAERVREWLDELPERLSVDATPVEEAAGRVADGVAAGFLTLLLAVTLVLDGDRLVANARRLVPLRRRAGADRLGRLVYDVIGRYVAGSVMVAGLAGLVMLSAALALDVPLAPLIGGWIAMTNLIPQVGGLLGGAPFVLLGTTQGAATGLACLAIFVVYQNIENHVLQPLIVGRAVRLSPPATMVAALVGVSAGGVLGALFAVPLLGATKAIYLTLRPPP
jgi:predicted PurR-regulated permease PerM